MLDQSRTTSPTVALTIARDGRWPAIPGALLSPRGGERRTKEWERFGGNWHLTEEREDTMRDDTAVQDEARFDSPLRLWIAIWQRQIVNARP
jgi:hypothetical protein